MEKFVIEGGNPLSGKIRIQGAKNAALPILASSLLAEGVFEINDVPDLLDIDVMINILRSLGAKISFINNKVTIDTNEINSTTVLPELMSQMRSSIFLMGPLLARFKEVTVSKPGGCAIGERKIDLHIKGLEALGAEVEEINELMICRAKELKGSNIYLDYPSVGATENIMMAATKAKGKTKIINAAKEPEIIDLQNFLNRMGAKIVGAGTDEIVIEGVETLSAIQYQVIPDRIVAGTLMLAVGITGGKVEFDNIILEHLTALIEYMKKIGLDITVDGDSILVERSQKELNSIDLIVTAPYPGFPTDMQAQFMSLLAIANGNSIVEERVFDSRFKHVQELIKLGANIQIDKQKAYIKGVRELHGDEVTASDLRAGAALVIAGLAASGKTVVHEINHIDRGYEHLERTLQILGGRITREIHLN